LDEKSKKRLTTFLLSLFVAVIFIGSYAAFGNISTGNSTSTTTVHIGQTYFVTGSANAVVSGYSSAAEVQVIGNDTIVSMVGNTLTQLQNNGSVSSYFQYGTGYNVFLNSYSPYQLQQLLYGMYPTNTIRVNSSTYVSLPKTIPLYYSTQQVQVGLPGRNYSVSMAPIIAIGSNVPVAIKAIIFANGTLYNNQITVNEKAT